MEIITEKEIKAARFCLKCAARLGAGGVRVSLSKNVLDTVALLNGETDKVTHCADRSIYLYLYIDGKYGTYSTNLIEMEQIGDFVRRAVGTTRMLAPDECRRLPDVSRCEKGAVTGFELGLYDPEYERIVPSQRIAGAMAGSIFSSQGKIGQEDGGASGKYRIISEECEWNDSVDDNFVIDSQGFEGRHIETSFSFWTEITICAQDGRKYSGYSCSASTKLSEVDCKKCSEEALEMAIAQMNPKSIKSGKRLMVVDRNASSRLLAPLVSALNALAIQQRNSFLEGASGKKVFSENLTVTDLARTPGKAGSRLFDTEGVATRDRDIIRNGVVETYFVNTYMAEKTGMEPTVEGVSRPVVSPFSVIHDNNAMPDRNVIHDNTHVIHDLIGNLNNKSRLTDSRSQPGMTEEKAQPGMTEEKAQPGMTETLSREDIMRQCGEGILVTGFNGGNCNQTTGDFSYGIEGFLFRNGKIVHPVKEMVITGNMISLWNSIVAAGSDPRNGTRWQIPTLAFKDVMFNA